MHRIWTDVKVTLDHFYEDGIFGERSLKGGKIKRAYDT